MTGGGTVDGGNANVYFATAADSRNDDTVDYMIPVFIVYKLIYSPSLISGGVNQYNCVRQGWPRYTYARSAESTNWNNPGAWTTF
jgi:hypothetical protein